MKKFLFFIVAIIATSIVSAEKTPKQMQSYNFQRGVQALYDGNNEEAIEYLTKELENDSKNGYAFAWMSAIRANEEEYGKALNNANFALQYLPKKDKKYTSLAYRLRGDAYLALEDTIKGIQDYTSAIKLQPKNENYYELRGQIYYELEQYDLSNKDYEKIIEFTPGNAMGHMGLGRNFHAQKKYDEAIKKYTYVISLDNEYSSGYAFRASSYYEQGEYTKAIKDVIKALEIDEDIKAFFVMHQISDSAFIEMKTQLNIMQKKYPNESKWSKYIAYIYQRHEDFESAVEYYDIANKIEYSEYSTFSKSECLKYLGRLEESLEAINEALQIDSAYYEYLDQRADLYRLMGNIDLALIDATKVVEEHPDATSSYSNRAWIESFGNKKQIEAAIEDYTTAIVLQDDIAWLYLYRGNCYKRLGNNESLANKDFKTVIEIAKEVKDTSMLLFANAYIGNIDLVKDLIVDYKASESGKEDYYNIACVYSIINQKDSALHYLDLALEDDKSITLFHLLHDYDMSNILNTAEFQEIITKYGLKDYTLPLEATQSAEQETTNTGMIDEIPFTRSGGVYEVKCTINELPLSFIFDTGASSVSISSLEATFMMKNGYLSAKDIVGNQHFIDANGDVSEGTIINLKSVRFGNSELTNVKASVVHNQKAPLLLGQTVLNRLGKIEIDYRLNKLKISK